MTATFSGVPLQTIRGVAHSRCCRGFDILLGFSKGFAEIGTLDGEFHTAFSTLFSSIDRTAIALVTGMIGEGALRWFHERMTDTKNYFVELRV